MGTIREEFLDEAKLLITADRNEDYGDPKDNFKVIADFWSTYKGVEFAPHDVAVMMILVKISRVQTSPEKADSWVDMAGYSALGGEVMPPQEG